LFAGAKASSALSELGYVDSNIECVSSPPDIRPCFERSWIFVVPLRAGGGTRLKILEAMAMELPIVSTAIGAEGIPCQDGEHILLADSPSDFANAVLRLLADEKLRLQLSNEAASWVRKNYDWKDLCESAVNSLRQQYEPTLAAASRKAVNV
jgi:glycosyltransferase involved in cell wall biosynthesis